MTQIKQFPIKQILVHHFDMMSIDHNMAIYKKGW